MEERVVLRKGEEESVAETPISGITLESFLWLFEDETLYSKVYGPIFKVVLVLISAIVPTTHIPNRKNFYFLTISVYDI